MNTRRDNADGPEDIDAAFAEIVADLERDSAFGHWPESTSGDTAEPSAATEAEPEQDRAPQGPGPRDEGPRDWTPEADEEEEHFVPPEPPPLPTPKPATLLGIAVIAVGVVLLLVPGLAGMSSTFTMPLGLVLISAGIGWLLLRLRQGPPASGDDGAQV